MRRNLLILVFVLVLLTYAGFIFLCVEEHYECDEHVVLIDSVEYDCREVSSYREGISIIKLCDGEKITIPTDRIKEIRNIKKHK
jgi:hypothetical protein